MTEIKKSPKAEPKGAISSFISLVELALILGFLIELMVNSYCWETFGYQVTINKLNQQYQRQTSKILLRNSWFATYYVGLGQMVERWVGKTWNDTKQDISKTKATKKIPSQFHLTQDEQKLWKKIKKAWVSFWGVFLGSLKIVIVKFASILVSFWLYLFAALLGALDGAVSRFIRTAEGGRESTFVFHKVANTILKIPALVLLVYLASPIPLNPELTVCLLALSFFWFFKIVTTNLKKFL